MAQALIFSPLGGHEQVPHQPHLHGSPKRPRSTNRLHDNPTTHDTNIARDARGPENTSLGTSPIELRL